MQSHLDLIKYSAFGPPVCLLTPGAVLRTARQQWQPNLMAGNFLGRSTGLNPGLTRKTAGAAGSLPALCLPAEPDTELLQLPQKHQLDSEDVKNVFGYSRGLQMMYDIGPIIGPIKDGVMREVVKLSTGRRFACRTIRKVPGMGSTTPRYLLKIQMEVDCMQQIGASMNAVYLADVFEDDDAVHMVLEPCKGGTLLRANLS